MDNIKDSQSILLNIKKSVNDIGGAINIRTTERYAPLYNETIYSSEKYKKLIDKINKGQSIDYNTDLNMRKMMEKVQ